MLNNELER